MNLKKILCMLLFIVLLSTSFSVGSNAASNTTTSKSVKTSEAKIIDEILKKGGPLKSKHFKSVKIKHAELPAKELNFIAEYELIDGRHVTLPMANTSFSTSRDKKKTWFKKGYSYFKKESNLLKANELEQGKIIITATLKLNNGKLNKKISDSIELQIRPNLVDELTFFDNKSVGRFIIDSKYTYNAGADTYIKAMATATFDMGSTALSSSSAMATKVDGLAKKARDIYDNIKGKSDWVNTKDKKEELVIPTYAYGEAFDDDKDNICLAFNWRTEDKKGTSIAHYAYGIGDQIIHVTTKGVKVEVKVYKGKWVRDIAE